MQGTEYVKYFSNFIIKPKPKILRKKKMGNNSQKRLPDAIIIGVKKCGTITLGS